MTSRDGQRDWLDTLPYRVLEIGLKAPLVLVLSSVADRRWAF